MKYEIIIRPEAERDLKEAFTWYEEKREGLGHYFLLQVGAGLKSLERNPEIFQQEYRGTRKHLIKRFPYVPLPVQPWASSCPNLLLEI